MKGCKDDDEEITRCRERKSLHDSKSELVMKLSSDVIDYEQVERKEVFKSSACLENEADAWEEGQIKVAIDSLLDIS